MVSANETRRTSQAPTQGAYKAERAEGGKTVKHVRPEQKTDEQRGRVEG